jgi:hypothetical protein
MADPQHIDAVNSSNRLDMVQAPFGFDLRQSPRCPAW